VKEVRRGGANFVCKASVEVGDNDVYRLRNALKAAWCSMASMLPGMAKT
jgi:hypothetical protein